MDNSVSADHGKMCMHRHVSEFPAWLTYHCTRSDIKVAVEKLPKKIVRKIIDTFADPS